MKIKRLAAIILVLSLLSAMLTVAGATDGGEETTTVAVTSAEETTEQTENSTETTEMTTVPEPSQSEENDVAEISICTRASGFPAFFHVWIYVHNISSETLKIGVYDLPAGEGVSIGSWGMMFTDLWGVYYNVEAFAANERNESDYFSLTKTLNMEETEKMSEEVSRFNWWDPIFNCTVFAYRVWNCTGEKWLFPIPLPWITQIQMAILGGKTNSLKMFSPEEERVYRQKGWGDEAVLEEAGDWAIKSFVAEWDDKKADITI